MRDPKTFVSIHATGLMARLVLAGVLLMLSGAAIARTPDQPTARQVDDSLWNVHQQENRTALLIGNSEYPGKARLPNPVRDVRAVAEKLSSLDFQVTVVEDATSREMKAAISQFADRLKIRSGVALLLFSGHGMQMRGRNALQGIDGKVIWANEVLHEIGVDLRLRIVMLDACRCKDDACKNPGFSDPITKPANTFISYSTSPGKAASDGPENTNSPFVKSLLTHIESPDVELGKMFMRVVSDTEDRTKTWNRGPQVPSMFSNRRSESEFYFVPERAGTPPTVSGGCGPQNPRKCFEEGMALANSRDLRGAMKRYHQGCTHGDMTSCVQLGRHYHEGSGVAQRLDQADVFYARACNSGHRFGCLWLGRLHKRSNPRKAAKAYTKLCHMGPGRYCLDLASAYLVGNGIMADTTRAQYLFRRSCGDGNLEACRVLGIHHQTGRFWARNVGEAKRLFTKACAGGVGDQMACKRLGALR